MIPSDSGTAPTLPLGIFNVSASVSALCDLVYFCTMLGSLAFCNQLLTRVWPTMLLGTSIVQNHSRNPGSNGGQSKVPSLILTGDVQQKNCFDGFLPF